MRALRTLLVTVVVVAGLTALLGGSVSPGTTSSPAAAMNAPATTANTRVLASADTTKEARLATRLLSGLKTRYRHLEGVTVTVGTTPNGEEAVAYYTEGQIVISRTHTVSIEKILAHEIWHIIDWRDNGRIDWHENLPPSNPSRYFSGSLPGRLTSRTTGPAV